MAALRRRCERTVSQISAWIDGDLSPRRARRVADHVAGCAECGRVARDLRRLRDLHRELPDHEPPAALLQQVLTTVAAEGRAARSARTWLWPAVVAAAVTVIVGALLVVPRGEVPAPRPQRTRGHALADAQLLASAQAELGRATRHYHETVLRLRRLAAEEARGWRPGRRESYQRRLRLLDELVTRCRAATRLGRVEPRAHEALVGAYRQQISYLQGVILDILPAGRDAR